MHNKRFSFGNMVILSVHYQCHRYFNLLQVYIPLFTKAINKVISIQQDRKPFLSMQYINLAAALYRCYSACILKVTFIFRHIVVL